MRHAMLDLETLDTRVTAVVLSVGAVIFDESRVHTDETLYAVLDLGEQLDTFKRTVSASTLCWWMRQTPAAQQAAFDESNGQKLLVVHANLTRFLRGVDRVWAKGTDFDIAILSHMFLTQGLPIPWRYNAARDMRTIMETLPDEPILQSGTIAHHALEDAVEQAYQTLAMMQAVARLNTPVSVDQPHDMAEQAVETVAAPPAAPVPGGPG